MIFKKLEYIEPAPVEHVLAGIFYYKQEDGEEVTAEFYVRCCVLVEDDPDSRGRREDAFNQQLTEEWSRLMVEDNKNIVYKEVDPSPFF